MTDSNQSISLLRQRMAEDMTMRKISPKTQSAYIRAVKKLAQYLHRSPDALTRMSRVYEPRKLPLILSIEEVTCLIEAAGGLKYKAALSVAYGAGLRASEVVHLKVSDIDSQRMVLRVEQGKGEKDRYAMLSPTLLELLRAWYRHACTQRMMLPGGCLCTRYVTPSPPTCWTIAQNKKSPTGSPQRSSNLPHIRLTTCQNNTPGPLSNHRQADNRNNCSSNPHSSVKTTQQQRLRPRDFLP